MAPLSAPITFAFPALVSLSPDEGGEGAGVDTEANHRRSSAEREDGFSADSGQAHGGPLTLTLSPDGGEGMQRFVPGQCLKSPHFRRRLNAPVQIRSTCYCKGFR